MPDFAGPEHVASTHRSRRTQTAEVLRILLSLLTSQVCAISSQSQGKKRTYARNVVTTLVRPEQQKPPSRPHERRFHPETTPQTDKHGLGFRHCCGKTRRGWFTIKRQTVAKRLRSKLQEVKRDLRRRMHQPKVCQGAWIRSVVQGWFNYYATPGNGHSLDQFRTQVGRYWLQVLRRPSQRGRPLHWMRIRRLVDRWRPRVRILHPYPNQRLTVTHPRSESYECNSSRTDLCGGPPDRAAPTATLMAPQGVIGRSCDPARTIHPLPIAARWMGHPPAPSQRGLTSFRHTT